MDRIWMPPNSGTFPPDPFVEERRLVYIEITRLDHTIRTARLMKVCWEKALVFFLKSQGVYDQSVDIKDLERRHVNQLDHTIIQRDADFLARKCNQKGYIACGDTTVLEARLETLKRNLHGGKSEQ